MNKKFLFFILFAFLLCYQSVAFTQGLTSNTMEESREITFGFENDMVTRYIWHGLNYNHGFIHQPSIWINLDEFTFFTWASLTQNEADYNPVNNEIDLALQYSNKLGNISIESSLTYIFALKTDEPVTSEIFLKFAYSKFETEIYSDLTIDVKEYAGSISGNVGIEKTLFDNDIYIINAGFCLGWANNQFNKDYIGFTPNLKLVNYSMLYAEGLYYLYDNIYIKPHFEYCLLLSSVFKKTSGNSLDNFGVALGIEF